MAGFYWVYLGTERHCSGLLERQGSSPSPVRRLISSEIRILRVRSPFDPGEITDAVNDPHHLHPVFDQPVECYPTLDNERPCVFGNLWPGRSELRVVFQKPTGLLDAVIDLVGDGVGT
jgi:hypothetical protein